MAWAFVHPRPGEGPAGARYGWAVPPCRRTTMPEPRRTPPRGLARAPQAAFSARCGEFARWRGSGEFKILGRERSAPTVAALQVAAAPPPPCSFLPTYPPRTQGLRRCGARAQLSSALAGAANAHGEGVRAFPARHGLVGRVHVSGRSGLRALTPPTARSRP
eukprot:scaffold3065_cov389-Prasinococcus_capsulatus_cf.AAC.13